MKQSEIWWEALRVVELFGVDVGLGKTTQRYTGRGCLDAMSALMGAWNELNKKYNEARGKEEVEERTSEKGGAEAATDGFPFG